MRRPPLRKRLLQRSKAISLFSRKADGPQRRPQGEERLTGLQQTVCFLLQPCFCFPRKNEGVRMNLFRRNKAPQRPWCAAVVAAAGESQRMGQDKLTLSLRGQPVILHTLWALERCPEISEIVVVTREDLIVPLSQLCGDAGLTKLTRLVRGGPTRTRSVQLGVQEVSDRAELIAVQDGARPLAPQWMLSEVIQKAALCSAAAPALPVKDTIKRVADGVVLETPERSQLYAVQTPQVFQADLLRAALQSAIEDGAAITDDCSAVERLGMKVTLTRGAEENIKLTTPADLAVAEALLEWREKHEDRAGV